MSQGAWCGFKYFDFHGQTSMTVTTRGTGNGELLVSTGRKEPPFARIPIAPSESWSEFRISFPALQGTLPLFFTFQGEGAMDFQSFEVR